MSTGWAKEGMRVLDAPSETQGNKPRGILRRRAFMRLSVQERCWVLAEQSKRMAEHYRRDPEARGLGGGDFVEC